MNKFEVRSIKSYNTKADNYDTTLDGKFTMKFKEMLINTVSIPNGVNVLDIACGNGTFLKMLSQYNSFSGYGTDIAEKMIENAKRINPTMSFEVASCDNLPFKDESMDVVTVCAAFHHFPNVNRFAKEVFRVLKRDGMVYIAEVYYPAFIRTICNPFVPLSKAGDVRFYGPNEIITLFENYNFHQELFTKEGHVQIIQMRK